MASNTAQPPADASLQGLEDAVDNEGADIGKQAGLDADGESDDSVYDPSDLEATRARQQGLGFGARDLARQRDASRPAPAADEEEEA